MADKFVVIDADGEVLNTPEVDVIDIGILERTDSYQREVNATTEEVVAEYADAIVDVYRLCEKHGYQRGCDMIHQWLVDHRAESRLVKIAVEAPTHEDEW